MGAKARDRLEQVVVHTRAEWRAWLQANHAREDSVWLVTYKKHMGDRHLPYDAIVEEALCFGWIDSLPRALDEERTMLLLSPRRRGSVWSQLNRNRVKRLVDLGLMTPMGLEKVERAKADGSWSILENLDSIPADLAAALAASPRAAANFRVFSPSTKRGIVAWIRLARREETRLRRIAEVVRLAAENRKPGDPPRRKKR